MKRPYDQYEVIEAIRVYLRLIMPAIKYRVIWPNGSVDIDAVKKLLLNMRAPDSDLPGAEIRQWFVNLPDGRKRPYINAAIQGGLDL